jgi:hypothetical protein
MPVSNVYWPFLFELNALASAPVAEATPTGAGVNLSPGLAGAVSAPTAGLTRKTIAQTTVMMQRAIACLGLPPTFLFARRPSFARRSGLREGGAGYAKAGRGRRPYLSCPVAVPATAKHHPSSVVRRAPSLVIRPSSILNRFWFLRIGPRGSL